MAAIVSLHPSFPRDAQRADAAHPVGVWAPAPISPSPELL